MPSSLSIVTAPEAGWRPMKVGGGGMVSKHDIAADGTIVVGTDSPGAYLYNRGKPSSGNAGGYGEFDNIVTLATLGVSFDFDAHHACTDISICSGNSTRLYLCADGFMWRGTRSGTSVSWTKLTAFNGGDRDLSLLNLANDGTYRTFGKFVAVHPSNTNVVFVGSPENGVSFSTDAGESWTTISTGSIPACTAGTIYTIAFDPTSTNRVYVGSWGNGVYRTDDYTGGTWTLTTSSPTTFLCLILDAAGLGWLVDNAGGGGYGHIWKYSSGSWAKVYDYVVSGKLPFQIAVDPANPSHIYASTHANMPSSASLLYSGDTGGTWAGGGQTVSMDGADIPWLEGCENNYGAGRIFFDNQASNKLISCGGLGVSYCNPPTDGTTAFTWHGMSTGIENLTVNWGVHPPGGDFVAAVWDRPVIRCNPQTSFDKQRYPSLYFPAPDFTMAWDMDYAAGTKTIVALLSWAGVDQSCVSNDSGKTWTLFSDLGTPPPITIDGSQDGGSIGGCIAASAGTTQNFVMVRTDYNDGDNNNRVYYTLNGGRTWTASAFGGTPAPPALAPTGWPPLHYIYQNILRADRVLPRTFYILNQLATADGGGLWKSTDGGANFSRVATRTAIPTIGIRARLHTVPGQAGHLFFTGAQNVDESLRRSTDQGSNWETVSGVAAVYDLGFGPPAAGQTYPSIAFYGKNSGTLGFNRTDDNFATIDLLSTTIGDRADLPKVIVADPNRYGLYRVGFQGTSFMQGYFP